MNNSLYTLRWTVTNACNTAYDEVRVYLGNVIGQHKDGGIIYYIDGTGEHGLICAPNDLGSGIMWGCEGVSISGADGMAIGDGAQNTLDIIAMCNVPGTAAYECLNFL